MDAKESQPKDPVTPAPDGSGLPALRPSAQSPGAPARERRRIWPWAMAFALIIAGGVGLYFQPWSNAPVPVMVETVEPGPATRVLAVNGRIAALHSVDIRALVGGSLRDLPVAEGDAVEQDEVLARIDAASQQTILRQAVAGLDAALVAEARARDALERAEALGANIARTERDAAERALLTAAQEVARATAQVDQAQVQLDNHTMRAPMSGTVLSLNVEPGQTIDAATVLMTVADLDQLIVETDVDEVYATQIAVGQPAVLQLAGEVKSRAGRVSFVSQRVDAGTGGLAVELSFDTPVRAPVGLTVTTNIIVDQQESAITAPRSAIDGDAVFVVVDDTATRRPVTVMDWPAARLIVTEGLAPGDMLITDAARLSDGQAVKVAGP
ncbi:efflux RND transporter periplasmic adaptor subunit [Lutimaribacter sp. EGI FJ00015]|uniref:Efflux RND transporter periplasmic adaptor subunit n=1 Tax=Lutimaribacter degradans TaxID=2945989 RepID=A0ACC5ZV69_9RHOB|nr:efflux RND transporter periplasmic adaptor subunit [Lutimaribacter sp. EGI FJ00013]MCM2561284.1 efflux RND transporter periplasmic adaptor subunit [Lutimaribacter sp. EGI FJ00013]MCO0611765.1 efflux RND transporter periplasmic adaptor subunit [Lutimaribacter sp. EGI FJ00015]MCO0635113.1 efflux RND transporter periplasmic adaptor subunit [Lutimaribacter sp. EGI FJ00014]